MRVAEILRYVHIKACKLFIPHRRFYTFLWFRGDIFPIDFVVYIPDYFKLFRIPVYLLKILMYFPY